MCYVLKDKIQALVDAGVLSLKSEQKKVTANMVTFNFGTLLKLTVQNGLVLILKARLDVINPMAEQQKTKGLISITTESGEIMWVKTNKPKLKGKSCNVVSLAVEDDSVTSPLSATQRERNLP